MGKFHVENERLERGTRQVRMWLLVLQQRTQPLRLKMSREKQNGASTAGPEREKQLSWQNEDLLK